MLALDRFLPVLLLLALMPGNAAGDAAEGLSFTRSSSEGLYDVTIESRQKPLVLGRMHAWIVTVSTADGAPVRDAEIIVGGGMPIHNHGFPTEPKVTRNYGDGRYLIEGVKFNMRGPWVIYLDITADEQTDSVAFDIDM